MKRRDFVKRTSSGALFTAMSGTILSGTFTSCTNSKKVTPELIPELFDEFMQYDAIGLSELIKTKQILLNNKIILSFKIILRKHKKQ